MAVVVLLDTLKDRHQNIQNPTKLENQHLQKEGQKRIRSIEK